MLNSIAEKLIGLRIFKISYLELQGLTNSTHSDEYTHKAVFACMKLCAHKSMKTFLSSTPMLINVLSHFHVWKQTVFDLVHSFFYKNNFIKTTALILAQNLRKAKNKARFVVPQNIRTKCLEQSVCDIWFSYSVKDFCYCISLMYYGKLRKKLEKKWEQIENNIP